MRGRGQRRAFVEDATELWTVGPAAWWGFALVSRAPADDGSVGGPNGHVDRHA
jgi:hypothetical protein